MLSVTVRPNSEARENMLCSGRDRESGKFKSELSEASEA
jgi:hypothetical protein